MGGTLPEHGDGLHGQNLSKDNTEKLTLRHFKK